jgi:polar amino acid transport system substrate-binding protein
LFERAEDARLLTARLVGARRPGRWVSAVIALVQYFSDSAAIFLGLANGKVDLYFGPTLSLKYDAAHIAGTKFLGQISSTPVGFVTAKNSPVAKALSDAVNELIANGDYAKIFAKWGVGGTEITKSTINPPTTF